MKSLLMQHRVCWPLIVSKKSGVQSVISLITVKPFLCDWNIFFVHEWRISWSLIFRGACLVSASRCKHVTEWSAEIGSQRLIRYQRIGVTSLYQRQAIRPIFRVSAVCALGSMSQRVKMKAILEIRYLRPTRRSVFTFSLTCWTHRPFFHNKWKLLAAGGRRNVLVIDSVIEQDNNPVLRLSWPVSWRNEHPQLIKKEICLENCPGHICNDRTLSQSIFYQWFCLVSFIMGDFMFPVPFSYIAHDNIYIYPCSH